MEILEIRTLRGPNYWSGYWKKLIIMRLDIGEYEKKPSDKIGGFNDRTREVMPGLQVHGCDLHSVLDLRLANGVFERGRGGREGQRRNAGKQLKNS